MLEHLNLPSTSSSSDLNSCEDAKLEQHHHHQHHQPELLLSPSTTALHTHPSHRLHQEHQHKTPIRSTTDLAGTTTPRRHHLSSPWNATPPRRLLTSTASPFSENHFRLSSLLESEQQQQTTDLSHHAFRNYGLLITLSQQQSSSISESSESSATATKSPLAPPRLQLQFCPDYNYRAIHPNAYAPAAFGGSTGNGGGGVEALGGGGSGVAVFGGHHPELGDIVMKHGSDKDLVELVALATVARELQARSTPGTVSSNPGSTSGPANHLLYRIPAFRFIYISPHHLGETRKDLWDRLSQCRDSMTDVRHSVACLQELMPIDEIMEESAGDAGSSPPTSSSSSSSETDSSVKVSTMTNGDNHSTTTTSSSTLTPSSTSFASIARTISNTSINNNNSSNSPGLVGLGSNSSHDDDDDEDDSEAEGNFQMLKSVSQQSLQRNQQHQQNNTTTPHALPPGVEISQSGTISGHREIALVAMDRGGSSKCSISLQGDTLNVVVPEGHYDVVHSSNEEVGEASSSTCHNHRLENQVFQLHGDGYVVLQGIVQDLLALMKDHKWKFTLGQKRIGGDDAGEPKSLCTTGNIWMYRQELKGRLLDHLIAQKIALVRDLVCLTTDQEQDARVLQQIKRECSSIATALLEEQATATITNSTTLKNMDAEEDASQWLSEKADNFVGNAIKKNFRADTGRFAVLVKLGATFREHQQQQQKQHPSFLPLSPSVAAAADNSLVLTREEELPARHLGCLTAPGALFGATFHEASMEPTILDRMTTQYWQTLLTEAVHAGEEGQPQQQHEHQYQHMACNQLWTCGLADAGLHNLFLSRDKIWFFDLGEPQLSSVPGFLTKFLFSYFHTLGMEEGKNTGGQDWVRRFEGSGHGSKKLRLTKGTTKLLSQAHSGFQLTLDRFINELFNGDDSVRWLLVQYVTLQLLSDASFCLQKWTIKGGGRSRDSNHQEGLENWLWRSLWDIYAACDLNSRSSLQRLKVKEPCQVKRAERNTQEVLSCDHKENKIQNRDLLLIQELAF